MFLNRAFTNLQYSLIGHLIYQYSSRCIHQNIFIMFTLLHYFDYNYCFGDYSWHHSVTAMLDKLRWPTLSDRRYYLTAAMMYKIVHGLVAIEASSYLTPITSATRGHLKRYLHIQTRTNAYYHSFFPSAVRIWNNLPACSVTASSLEQFTSLINYNICGLDN